jgi:phenylacetate-CoA ligase
MLSSSTSNLPIYRRAVDWDAFDKEYAPPDVFAAGLYRASRDEIESVQERRFLELMKAVWANPFYSRRFKERGVEAGDIRRLSDISKLPIYNTEDIKDDQERNPPFGDMAGFATLGDLLKRAPAKLQTSGGTTGKPRIAIHGPIEWEMHALSTARGLYGQGGRPGDIMQIPSTCSLATLGWGYYTACQYYLGILPLTTGSGLVTPTRRQLEIAFSVGTNIWLSFPEYLVRLAQSAKAELGRDVRELRTKFIASFLGADLEGSLRRELENLWGCPVYDNYGTNELGCGAFECQGKAGLHFMEDLHYFEVLDVDTNQPVAPGETGNLVVTTFHRRVQPVVRFNLRDLGRVIATDRCSCGSNFRRMDHLLGRSDNMVRMKGVNIYPMSCLPAIRSDGRTTGEWICEVFEHVIEGIPKEHMIVHVEVRKDATSRNGLLDHLKSRLKTDLGAAVDVKLVEEGSLASSANLGEGKASRLIDRRPNVKRK